MATPCCSSASRTKSRAARPTPMALAATSGRVASKVASTPLTPSVARRLRRRAVGGAARLRTRNRHSRGLAAPWLTLAEWRLLQRCAGRPARGPAEAGIRDREVESGVAPGEILDADAHPEVPLRA